MRLREGCAAKTRAGDKDTVPAVAASFINWRRLSIDDRPCSSGVFLFFAIKFLSPSQEICTQPFNRRTVMCQSTNSVGGEGRILRYGSAARCRLGASVRSEFPSSAKRIPKDDRGFRT